MANDWYAPIQARVTAIADELDADVYAYFGEMTRSGADRFCKLLSRRSRKNIILMISTYGGDASASYLIGRRIQRAYNTKRADRFKDESDPKFICFVPWICKSAGTILTLAADELLVAEDAELGPIDVQVRRHDEVGERTSGLTSIEALMTLQGRSKTAFLDYFRTLRLDAKMSFSTKIAAEIASNLTVGLFKPVFDQLDPYRLAEMERSQRIGAEYGRRLDAGNLKDEGLVRLLSDYPSHGFIIDRDEMKEIFRKVTDANAALEQIANDFEYAYTTGAGRDDELFIFLLSAPPTPAPDRSEDHAKADHGGADGAGSATATGKDGASSRRGKGRAAIARGPRKTGA